MQTELVPAKKLSWCIGISIRELLPSVCHANAISGSFSALQAVSATALAFSAAPLAHFAIKKTNGGGWGYTYLSFSSSIEKCS